MRQVFTTHTPLRHVASWTVVLFVSFGMFLRFLKPIRGFPRVGNIKHLRM